MDIYHFDCVMLCLLTKPDLRIQLVSIWLWKPRWHKPRCCCWNRCSTSRQRKLTNVVPYCKSIWGKQFSCNGTHLFVLKLMDYRNGDYYMCISYINCLVGRIVVFSSSGSVLWKIKKIWKQLLANIPSPSPSPPKFAVLIRFSIDKRWSFMLFTCS